MALRLALMKRTCALAFLVTLPIVRPALLADVVELKTGEQIQGKFRQASSGGVVMEVAGQSITLPLGKVRAIYFGTGPAVVAKQASPASEALEALEALESLQSVASGGPSYRDYAPRVLDARVQIDRYLRLPSRGDGDIRNAIGLALRYYELASQAWNASIFKNRTAAAEVNRIIVEDESMKQCLGLSVYFFDSNPFVLGQNPSFFWPCAKDKIAEARRLLESRNETVPLSPVIPPSPRR